jgi:GxxExxY protein
MSQSNYIHSDITEVIIKSFYKVYNTLGYGFLEKVYDRALLIELKKTGLSIVYQPRLTVLYEGFKVGLYVPDLLVENVVVVENKAAITLTSAHEDQLKNALRASEKEVGLLLNFGITPQFKRKVFAKEFKKN